MRPKMMRVGAAALVLGLALMAIVPSTGAQDYTIGPGDTLDISVLGEWSAPLTVTSDGKITLPQAREISIDGLTLLLETDNVTEPQQPSVKDPLVTTQISPTTTRIRL